MHRLLTLALVLAATPATAMPVTLRFATAAPDGTAWARLFRAMSRDIESDSKGEISSKWYFGGIAGNEMEMLDRLKRGQLDVVMSGGMLCMKLAPSMKVLRLMGLFRTREEATYILGRLRPVIEAEMARTGFRNLGNAGLGSDMLFTREPVRTLADLRKARLWLWDLDDPMQSQLVAMGVGATPLPLESATRAYEDGHTQGFLAVPAAALAFQWSTAAKYLSELRLGYLAGCMIITDRAWDQLSQHGRKSLSESTAKFQARLEQLGRQQDEQLLGGLFVKQGLKMEPVSDVFNAEFYAATRAVRDKMRGKLAPPELIDKVLGWLADFRTQQVQVDSAP